jgi:RNA recognition motif-containing protein
MNDVAMETNNLFVGNFSWNLGESDMEELFAPYGELESAKLMMDKFNPTRSRGFGFVEFKNLEDAVKAKEELDGKEVDGREIKVDFAKPRRDYNEAE